MKCGWHLRCTGTRRVPFAGDRLYSSADSHPKCHVGRTPSHIDPFDPSDVDGRKKAHITIGLILAMLVVSMGVVALLADIKWNPPPLPNASCGLAFDSTVVRGRNERGFYHVRGADGTFALSVDLVPYDPRDCVRLGAERGCRLSDIDPPFTVVNASGSDTLTVVREGISVLFRVPMSDCEEDGLHL